MGINIKNSILITAIITFTLTINVESKSTGQWTLIWLRSWFIAAFIASIFNAYLIPKYRNKKGNHQKEAVRKD